MIDETAPLLDPQRNRLVSETQAESEALFKSIGEGAIATDEFGHITRVNPKALAILDLTAEETVGTWFPRLIRILRPNGTPMPLIERPIVRMFLSGKVISEKVIYVTKKGVRIPVGVTVSPIVLDGKPVGAVQVFRDITLENEIDRMKSEFISLASHQLRTPLSTVQTYTHMLDDGYMGEASPEQRRALQTILTATNTMNELIGMLLNIARIESGSIAVNSKALNTSVVIDDILNQLRMSAEAKNISLHFTPPAEPIFLTADQLIVKEILLNLVGNAIKYTPVDGDVTARVQETPTNVRMSVIDTGIGIPKDAQTKIFGKFFRAPNVVRQETTGTGLGLYVVRGLATTLHGRVWFKSEENKGTTFYVSLPKKYGEHAKASID